MNIPVAHIQGGEVTGSIDEKVRHAVTKLSDIHLVASKGAYERVLKLGEDPQNVFNTGCPSIDLAAEIAKSPKLDFDPIKKYGGVGKELDLSRGYIVVMQHPVTSEYSESRAQIKHTLKAADACGYPVLWFWPNVDAGSDGTSSGIRSFREHNETSQFHFFKNMAPHDFLRLLINSKCLMGNSSVGIRECAFLGVPVVNIGSRARTNEEYCEERAGNAAATQPTSIMMTHKFLLPFASNPRMACTIPTQSTGMETPEKILPMSCRNANCRLRRSCRTK
jgi:UDP-hydrolysing UDP-N-acetyl-D-glucosamine 2-epimerase